MKDILADLNPAQQEAVVYHNGPLLVLAGAGSGKTRVLIYRTAWLIAEKKVPPENILLLTFTNKAAGEMKDRLQKILTTNHQPLTTNYSSINTPIFPILKSRYASMIWISEFMTKGP